MFGTAVNMMTFGMSPGAGIPAAIQMATVAAAIKMHLFKPPI